MTWNERVYHLFATFIVALGVFCLVGVIILVASTREPKIRLTPIECYTGRTLTYKGVMRGSFYDRDGFWRFTDHRTGKIVIFAGFCKRGSSEMIRASLVAKGALPKDLEVW